MKNFTVEDFLKSLTRQKKFIHNNAKKENRDLDFFEKEFLNDIEETENKIKKTDNTFRRVKELAQNNYTNESIILTVTFFEIMMRIIVKDYKSLWFYLPHSRLSSLSPEKKVIVRKKIQIYLEKRKLFDQYLKNIHLYYDMPNPEIEAFSRTLFVDDEKKGNIDKINFQNLDGENGVREIFKLLFDLDITLFFDQNRKISQERKKMLVSLIAERHKIIHSGESSTLSSEEIIKVLDSVDQLCQNITNNLNARWYSEIKSNMDKDFEAIKKKIASSKTN